MPENYKKELKISDMEKLNEVAMVDLIDKMMEEGVSRLKVTGDEELDRGELLKKYHHGRCDIDSPFDCGTPFDVIE